MTTRKKTLLLVFIHGFKGGDDTFARFPPHLRALLSHALPRLTVAQVQYPKFETRGDLNECVSKFKEWLQNKVIDLEVANGTASPTIDPSVRVVLIGHSMGGIVGAETILSIARDAPIPFHTPTNSTADASDSRPSSPPAGLFPSIVGLLAFDTPYLGISPGVLAHNAESHIQTLAGMKNAYSSVTGMFDMGGGPSNGSVPPASVNAAAKGLPSANDVDVASVPAWSRWGRYAMYAGAAGAVVAGGAAAYANRQALSEGWKWSTSHLEFVGSLSRPAELQKRVDETVTTSARRGFGFRNLYTQLGRSAGSITVKSGEGGTPAPASTDAGMAFPAGLATTIAGPNRTFCNLPKKESANVSYFESTVNDRAENEISAHMGMFAPKDNPGYYSMSERAKEVILQWVSEHWILPDDEHTEPGADHVDGKLDDDDVEIVEKDEVEGVL